MANKSFPPNGSRSPKAKARREAVWHDKRLGLARSDGQSRVGTAELLGWASTFPGV